MATALLDAPSKIVTGIPQIRGERCAAIQSADGTWCVKALAIFAAVPAGEKGNAEPIDDAWLSDCVATMQRRYHARNQYIAPTHVYHHDQTTEDAGFFVPTHVAPYEFSDGVIKPAIYADLFSVPDAVYQRIKANRLAFRSVEIIKYAERELGSLALMKDEVPFHRFALTTIGEEIRAEAVTQYTATSPLVKTIQGKKRAVHLFRFGGDMADDEKKDGPPRDEKSGDEGKDKFGKDGGDNADGDGKDDKSDAAQPDDMIAGQNQMAASLTQGQARIEAMLVSIFALLSGAGGAMAGNGTPSNLSPVKPVTQMSGGEAEASFKAREDSLAKREADFAAKEAALGARLGAVEAVLKAQSESSAAERMFAAGMDALAGRNVPEAVKTSLRELAKGPEAQFKATLEIVKTTLPYDPPTYRDGGSFAAATTDVAEMPEAVQKAIASGKGEKAVKQFRDFEEYEKKTVSREKPDFERFAAIDNLRNSRVSRHGGN